MDELAGTFDQRWIKALAHPVRIAILQHLYEHGVATPASIAVALEVPHGTISYHVGRLRDAEQIRLVRRTQRRGSSVYHYALTSPEATRDAMRRVGLPIRSVRMQEVAPSDPWERLRRALNELRRRREAQSISRDALARSLRMKPAQLARIERGGTDPRSTVLMAIAHELGTTLGEVFTAAES